MLKTERDDETGDGPKGEGSTISTSGKCEAYVMAGRGRYSPVPGFQVPSSELPNTNVVRLALEMEGSCQPQCRSFP